MGDTHMEESSPLQDQTAPLSLLDIFIEVPGFLESLPATSTKALLCTDAQLHRAAQAVNTRVKFPHPLSDPHPLYHLHIPVLLQGNFMNLKVLELRGVDLSFNVQALATSQWPQLTGLELASTHLGGSSIPYLVQAQWPALQYLGLADNSLDNEAAAALIHNNWPQLARLDVSRNMIEADAMAELVQNDWPGLTTLRLDWNEMLPSESAYLHLTQAPWQLQRLDLRYNKVNATVMSYLVQADWCEMRYLHLRNNKLDAEAVSTLITANWPLLETLLLGNNPLHPGAFQFLARGKWPLLDFLDVGDTDMTLEGLLHLLGGQWPKLRSLVIAENKLDSTAILMCSRAPWKSLWNLDISHNYLTQECMEEVKVAASHLWPQMKRVVTCHDWADCRGKCTYSKGCTPVIGRCVRSSF